MEENRSLMTDVEVSEDEKIYEDKQADAEVAAAAEEAGPIKPENLGEAFWDTEKQEVKLNDLLTDYEKEKEKALGLRRKLSEKGAMKPPTTSDQYEISIKQVDGKDVDPIIGKDSDAMSILREKAHDANLTTEQFSNFMGEVLPALTEKGLLTSQAPELSEEELKVANAKYVSEEMEKLGADGDKVIHAVKSWGNAMVNRGVLSIDEVDTFQGMAHTAESLVVLNKIRALTGETAIPVTTNTAKGLPSRHEIDAIIGSKEWQEGNPAAVKKVEEYFQATS